MKELLKMNWSKKMESLLKEYEGNETMIRRIHDFRNLQLLDNKFHFRKQKVVWPIFNQDREAYDRLYTYEELKMKKNMKKEKVGFNSKRFRGLESVKKYSDHIPLRSKHMPKIKQTWCTDDENNEIDSDDPHVYDFFESSYIWKYN